MLTKGNVIIELTSQQALVLFELLHRIDETDGLKFEDQAEERVLWNIEGMLEKQLIEVISPGYNDYLSEVRRGRLSVIPSTDRQPTDYKDHALP